MAKTYHSLMKSQRMQKEWQREKAPVENRLGKEKFGVLENTGFQKNAKKWENREKQREIPKQKQQILNFSSPAGAGSTGNDRREEEQGKEGQRWTPTRRGLRRGTNPAWWDSRRAEEQEGVCHQTRFLGAGSRSLLHAKHTQVSETLFVLPCWGIWWHAGDSDFIPGKGSRCCAEKLTAALFLPLEGATENTTQVTFRAAKALQTSSS